MAYLTGVRLNPCGNGCDQTPIECGAKGGLTHDIQTGGSYCYQKQERIVIVKSLTS